MPKRLRYVTEYKAKFKPINFKEAYRPPVLKPRAPLAIESPILREIAVRESNEIKEITQPKSPGNIHKASSVSKNSTPSKSVVSDVNAKVQKSKLNSDEKKSAKDNQSLQYKAGLAHAMPRPGGKENFLSEYQRQFNWKKPARKESPIMSAEQVIFRSHEGVSPQAGIAGERAKFSFKTEYQSQYVKHPWKQVKRDRPLPPSGKPDYSDDSEDSGVHVSSPSPSSSPEKQSSQPKVPVRPFICQSEYQSNFNPPSNFQYAKGAWVRAGAPHLHVLQENQEGQDEDLLSKTHTSWFQQVLELRKKAQKYKLLARDGSQALQVFRRDKKEKGNTLLPNANVDSSLNECDIPRPEQQVGNHLSSKVVQPTEKEKTVHSESNENLNKICTPQRTSPTSSKSESDYPGNQTQRIVLDNNAKKLSTHQQISPTFSISSSEQLLQRDERSPSHLSSSVSSINLSEELNLSADGRTPTPELLDTKDPRRHHLDVTTPSKGGSLLVSPPLDHVRRGPFIMHESDTCSSRSSPEAENSFLSQRAMEKRRALATKTFKRARKRREKLARRTGI